MSTEELGEVFAGSHTSFLIEMKQAHCTILVVALLHGILTQHFVKTRIELGVVAQHVIVEEEAIVHMSESPNVVGVEVATLGAESIVHFRERTFIAIDTRCAGTEVPQHHV